MKLVSVFLLGLLVTVLAMFNEQTQNGEVTGIGFNTSKRNLASTKALYATNLDKEVSKLVAFKAADHFKYRGEIFQPIKKASY
ncbi:hypothetical protein [Bacteriovorax sp. Seq25_V]|uniref:hypothetical protein n=1 Tax=Bacteriovorax sp. Seq25_V TaxID=1201288 RepID=UPI000389E2E3|nr:hypothetical protein [Bacteriovorax sp. Seq25_V]EQC47462.1 hypothetical protein M900_0728 [Bacteriovorax sp. Seq25_V]